MAQTEETVAQLGESGILARILPILPQFSPAHDAEAGLLGPGDDAAVVGFPDGRVVLSIDTQTEDQDFRLQWKNGHASTGHEVGFKCVAQNLSDINAMGAEPVSLVISLTLPPATPVSWVEELAGGIAAAIHELGAGGCTVAGGDLGRGREISVTATALGTTRGRPPVQRSGARPGDVLAVAGTPGRAAAGWHLLESEHLARDYSPELRDLQDSQTRPRPVLSAGPAAARAGATAMMDISDSLLIDGQRLAEASGVSLHLDQSAALDDFARPLLPAAELLQPENPRETALKWVLTGGEDFALLATFPPSATLPESFIAIGSVMHNSPDGLAHVSVDVAGYSQKTAERAGWDHFDAP